MLTAIFPKSALFDGLIVRIWRETPRGLAMVTTHSDLDSQNCTIQTKWNIALAPFSSMSHLGLEWPHVCCVNQRKEVVQLPTGIWGQIQLYLTLREPTREENKNIN